MKRRWKLGAYIFLGIGSFIFFFYLTFPYEVLKETIVLKASETTGLNITIGELSPSFPMGLKSRSVGIGQGSGGKLKLNRTDVSLGFWALFIGEARVRVALEDASHGTFDLSIGISVLDVLRGSYPVWPRTIYLEARNFLFGDLVDFILKRQAGSSDVNPLVQPLLESIDVDGLLNADVDLRINSSDLSGSAGTAEVRLVNAVVKSLNENLEIPDQAFTKALIKARLAKGILSVDESSGFISQDLSIGIGGRIVQKPHLARSDMDFVIPVTLGPPLQEQFGLILDTVAQRQTKGSVEIRISGALDPGPHISVL